MDWKDLHAWKDLHGHGKLTAFFYTSWETYTASGGSSAAHLLGSRSTHNGEKRRPAVLGAADAHQKSRLKTERVDMSPATHSRTSQLHLALQKGKYLTWTRKLTLRKRERNPSQTLPVLARGSRGTADAHKHHRPSQSSGGESQATLASGDIIAPTKDKGRRGEANARP